MSQLLLDEKPLVVLPSLAKIAGVNGAILLQQCHWICSIKEEHEDDRTKYDGHFWCNYSYEQWHEKVLPWVSLRTTRREIEKLESDGFLISTKPKSKIWDHKKWYRINYTKLGQIGQTNVDKMATSNWSDCPDLEVDKMARSSYIKKDLKKELSKEKEQDTFFPPEETTPPGVVGSPSTTAVLDRKTEVTGTNQNPHVKGKGSAAQSVKNTSRQGARVKSRQGQVREMIGAITEDVDGFIQWRGKMLANSTAYQGIKVSESVVLQFYAKHLRNYGSDLEKAQAIADVEETIQADIEKWPQRFQQARQGSLQATLDRLVFMHREDPSIRQSDPIAFEAEYGLSLNNFKKYLFEIGEVK